MYRVDLEDLETFWGLLGAKKKKKRSQGGHRLRSQRWRERLEGRLIGWNVIYNLFKCWLNVIWNLTTCRCRGLLLRHKRREKKDFSVWTWKDLFLQNEPSFTWVSLTLLKFYIDATSIFVWRPFNDFRKKSWGQATRSVVPMCQSVMRVLACVNRKRKRPTAQKLSSYLWLWCYLDALQNKTERGGGEPRMKIASISCFILTWASEVRAKQFEVSKSKKMEEVMPKKKKDQTKHCK